MPRIIAAAASFKDAVAAVRRGGVIAYPTETLYGLGADPFNEEAIERLFGLKGRSSKSPISVLIKDAMMLPLVASQVTPVAQRLMEAFWPGPLTIIFKAAPALPASLTAGTGTIGVRVSSSPVCKKLLDELSSPITTTSANPSGKAAATSAAESIAYFGSALDAVIDAGPLAPSPGSTVVDACGPSLRVIREGAIPAKNVLRIAAE